MNMHHIIISKCTAKRCKKRRTYCRKTFSLNSRNIFLANSFILYSIVILCTTYMMAFPILTSNLMPFPNHPGA